MVLHFNGKVFILPRVAELFIHKEKQRGCPLFGENKYTHIYIKYICVYILFICLRLWFRRLGLHHQSFFFLIINIIFHGVGIWWILKVFRFYLAVKLAFLNIKQISGDTFLLYIFFDKGRSDTQLYFLYS